MKNLVLKDKKNPMVKQDVNFFPEFPKNYTFAHEIPGQSLASSSECKASNWKMGASRLNTAMEIGDININHSQMSVLDVSMGE